VLSLIMAGDVPGHVPDDVIAELRSRERDGWSSFPSRAGPSPGIASESSPARSASASH
jgi:hypothetical protein